MAEYNFRFDWNKISTLGKVRILVEQVVGSPSQAQISQAVADYIDSHPGALSPLSAATKSALLQIAQKVAYIDENGQSYYNALSAALNAKALLSITAVYTQSGTVYDTDSLDSLKSDLVVTAYYDDGTSADVTSASVLSGTLAKGTSTVTVTFGNKTATFTVTVKHILGNFVKGYNVITADGYRYRYPESVGNRASMSAPIANNNCICTVTDSTKYNIMVLGVTSLTPVTIDNGYQAVDNIGYHATNKTVAWKASDSEPTAVGVWIALKKLDGSSFTDAELANGAEAVFTFTEGN